ncbi:MAG: hypothetical protein ACYC0V_19000 [Armatimonadota bacterium]
MRFLLPISVSRGSESIIAMMSEGSVAYFWNGGAPCSLRMPLSACLTNMLSVGSGSFAALWANLIAARTELIVDTLAYAFSQERQVDRHSLARCRERPASLIPAPVFKPFPECPIHPLRRFGQTGFDVSLCSFG